MPACFLFEHPQLIEATVFLFLLSDVVAHLRLVPPYRRHVISPRPKVQPDKLLLPIHESSGDRYMILAFPFGVL